MKFHPRKIYRTFKGKIGELKRQHLFIILTSSNLLILSITAYLVYLSIPTLPSFIPLMYFMPWGEPQLVPKEYLYIPIFIGYFVLILNTLGGLKNLKDTFIANVKFYAISAFFINLALSFFTLRIIYFTTIEPISLPDWARFIVFPIILAFIFTLIAIPLVIKFANRFGYVDDPLKHKHPAMLLTKSIPRAGGLAFFIGVLIPSLLILPLGSSQKLMGIFIGTLICVLVGLRDDKKDVNPFIRLAIMTFAVFITVMSGIIMIYIPNPLGDAIKLDDYKFIINFLGDARTIHYISVIAAVIWMVVMMNFMSWANGTDGVYAGLITISALVITILIYTTSFGIDKLTGNYVQLGALIAGAGLAMAIFTWPPQKLLWGFGATAPALMLAALSIVGSTKIATTLLVLIIPFLDGTWAIIRRLSRKKSPFFGDREHLHHILLDELGWTKGKIALFYWAITALLAIIGISTQGITRAIALTVITTVAIILITYLNFKTRKTKTQSVPQNNQK